MHHDICVHIILIKQRYQTTFIARNASLETRLLVKGLAYENQAFVLIISKQVIDLLVVMEIIIFFVLYTFALLRNKTFDKVMSL